jgi:hypothetical protein
VFYLDRLKFEGLPSDLSRFAFRQVFSFAAQKRPGYPGVYICQGHRSYVFMPPAAKVLQPQAARVSFFVDYFKYQSSALYQ